MLPASIDFLSTCTKEVNTAISEIDDQDDLHVDKQQIHEMNTEDDDQYDGLASITNEAELVEENAALNHDALTSIPGDSAATSRNLMELRCRDP